MGIPAEAFLAGDVYIDYPYERVMFRFVKEAGKIFHKFYGDSMEKEIPRTSTLLAEAEASGIQITAEEYAHGMPASQKRSK